MRRVLFLAGLVVALGVIAPIAPGPARAVAPTNDGLGAALVVAFQPYTNVQTNVDATVEIGENTAYTGCQGDSAAAGNLSHSVWYKYTHPGAPATLQVDTLGPGIMDAVVRISTGPASSPTHAALTQVACGDNEWGGSWAAATFAAATGQTYYIQAGAFLGSAPGTFALNISPIVSTDGALFTVNSTADSGDSTPDGDCDNGPGLSCTFREAIQEASGLIGTDVITFEAGAGGAVTLSPASPYPTLGDAVIDARTQNAFAGSPVVTLDGVGATGTGNALSFAGLPVSVRGLVIGRFAGNAVFVQSNNNVIQGNYLGVGGDGVTDIGSTRAVYVTGGRSGTVVGGTTPSARNVISGNLLGVFLDGSSAAVTNNRVAGNYIGTNASGTGAIPNDDYGVFIAGSPPGSATGNIIGDSTNNSLPSGGQNVISGNDGDGIGIWGSTATGNTVAGNYIGVNAAGSAAVPNTGRGINIDSGASSNTIGGLPAWARNLVSGNTLDGVRMVGPGTTSNSVVGNYIGTDAAGNADLGNGAAGVAIENAPGNVVGGSSSGPPNPPGNIVSGNTQGITILGDAADGNVVQGNVVGLAAAGTAALGNSDVGIWVLGGADNNIVGGTVPGARNISSANARGIAVFDVGTTGNVVNGNFAGTNVSGTAAIGNASEGVGIGYGASSNVVGGAAAGARNVLSGNGQNGVRIGEGVASNNNTVAGNYIGTNATGDAALGNGTIGVWVLSASAGNTIGGDVSDARNVISGNGVGVTVSGGASNNIKGNYIGLAADGQTSLGNAGNGVTLESGASQNTIGGVSAVQANVISGNGLAGVGVTSATATGNLLIGNFIGTDATGTLDRGNAREGVKIDGGADTTGIGNGAGGGGNVISGNDKSGIAIIGDGSTNMEIWGNKVGTNSAGTAAIPNTEGGILVWGAVNTSIGGNTAGQRNLVSGNASTGIFILPQVLGLGATGSSIRGNYIGTAADGITPLGNAGNGILLFNAPSNTIGGTGAGEGNTIAFNAGHGVRAEPAVATGNSIRRNAIHTNGLLGIDLSGGANGGVLPPTILSFNPPASEVVGETCAFCSVEVFSDSADEGRVYQGTATADVFGDWTVSAPFVGPNITATTIDGTNTSEFSAPFTCPDGDGEGVCDAGDNCPSVANQSQSDADGDGLGDHCDTGDSDGDGFTDEAEARYIGTNAGYPCGNNGWPADLVSAGLSANKLTLADITSFLAPAYRLNTSPGDGNFSARWDLVPGRGIFAKYINLQDLTAIIPSTTASTARPPMFGGAPAMNQTCPYPP